MMRSVFVFTLLVSASIQYDWYIIRSAQSKGLVLDGYPQVTVKYYTGGEPQLWRFEETSETGVYYIIYKPTGNVLDSKQSLVILSPKEEGNANQQWIVKLDNGRIYNVGQQKNLDVGDAVVEPGRPVHLAANNGNITQEYDIEFHERD